MVLSPRQGGFSIINFKLIKTYIKVILLTLCSFVLTANASAPESKIKYQDNFVTGTYISPQDYLRQLTPDYELLSKIAYCESGWKSHAKSSISTASGLFQFISSTWNKYGEGDVFNPYDNIRAAVKLYNKEGTTPWNASKSCWKN